jgi:curved DNA-binding protein CbpA
VKFFNTLGISPAHLDVDPKILEQKFYEAAFRFHPDRNPGSPEAQIKTAEINDAYRTLRDPWRRASYVLAEWGAELGTSIPTSLAELYFEAQESSDTGVLTLIEQRLETEFQARNKRLADFFQQVDGTAPTKQQVDDLKELVTEHKYATSMLHDLQSKKAKNL